MNFTYDWMRDFLLHGKKISKFVRFKDWNTSEGILLRHDVDFDIQMAYDLAMLEKECGVTSTYFVMVSSPIYNPQCLVDKKMIREMSNLGFEIGLHFDPTVYGNISSDHLEKKVDHEIVILSEIVGMEATSVTTHQPSTTEEFPLFPKYNNGWEPRIFHDQVYMSDSCMDFRNKDPFEFIKKSKHQLLQVSLHPCHYSKKYRDYINMIAEVVTNYINKADDDVRGNREYYKKIGQNRLLDFFGVEIEKTN